MVLDDKWNSWNTANKVESGNGNMATVKNLSVGANAVVGVASQVWVGGLGKMKGRGQGLTMN